ncbi:ParA family protein [Acetobacter oryzifermentans]|uniref:ParA family protein n=1 Tax=Acetobacter oryzifermentans TaxID=1633874 RepID=UPI0039BF99C3
MKVLTFFNNKGGVGKTTLTANIAAYAALELNKRVLVIDCDPQCNITQHILGDEKIINMYWPDINSNSSNNKTRTVLNVVQPIVDGDAHIDKLIRPLPAKNNRFGVDLLPGDLRFSLFEDNLSQAWNELPSGKAGGFRVIGWLSSYLQNFADKYDLVMIDVSPSLGPINRSVMLCSDYFITPLGADAFSLLGIRNISQWIVGWSDLYETSVKHADKFNPGALHKFNINTQIRVKKGYLGYTLQQYIAKSVGGSKRPTKAYERIISDVPTEVSTYLSRFETKKGNLHLGDIPNLYSLIPISQKANSPIIALKTKDGLVGSQFGQVLEYKKMIGELTSSLIGKI